MMKSTPEQSALLRTLAWYEVLEYAPTRAELLLTIECDQESSFERPVVWSALKELLDNGCVIERRGRIAFPETVDAIEHRLMECDPLQPRKRRRARRVARWLSLLPTVRFIALANTTALGNARDEGDLDFFVIVRAGSIWTTRLLGGLPFRLFHMTPRPGQERDAVCLSYFIADDALDLTTHQLAGTDPYFRSWFLSLLPLYDDGVSADLWNANRAILSRYPFAGKWIIPPDLKVSRGKSWSPVRAAYRLVEPLARMVQLRWFPETIRERMNRDTTVLVNDRVLKFHTTDGRIAYRGRFEEVCRKRGIAL